MDKLNYKAKVHCSNCNFRNEIKIPKRLVIWQAECPNCKCRELQLEVKAKDLPTMPAVVTEDDD